MVCSLGHVLAIGGSPLVLAAANSRILGQACPHATHRPVVNVPLSRFCAKKLKVRSQLPETTMFISSNTKTSFTGASCWPHRPPKMIDAWTYREYCRTTLSLTSKLRPPKRNCVPICCSCCVCSTFIFTSAKHTNEVKSTWHVQESKALSKFTKNRCTSLKWKHLVVTATAEYPLPILGEGAAKNWRFMVVGHALDSSARAVAVFGKASNLLPETNLLTRHAALCSELWPPKCGHLSGLSCLKHWMDRAKLLNNLLSPVQLLLVWQNVENLRWPSRSCPRSRKQKYLQLATTEDSWWNRWDLLAQEHPEAVVTFCRRCSNIRKQTNANALSYTAQ